MCYCRNYALIFYHYSIYYEFLLKSLHYAQFYSFYATDSIIILHLLAS